MYFKLSRQVDQDLGVLKASISELKQSLLQKWSTELERISLSSHEIKGAMNGFNETPVVSVPIDLK